jgi:hypothetical protein
MTRLLWDQVGERVYETGVDHGVLFIQDVTGAYSKGYAWNGLTTVTESPSGAESNPQYADNIKYINLLSAEEFGATVEAFTYPDEFSQCDGTAIVRGVRLGQQTRKPFGLSYRTLVGNDLKGTDAGYKLHLIYAATAAPSEKAYATVNDSPEAITFSWELTTTSTAVGSIDGVDLKPVASMTIDSTDVPASAMAALELILYGSAGVDPRLPAPAEVLGLFAGTIVQATAAQPTYTSSTHTIAIPVTTGIDYRINGAIVAGNVVITKNTVVTATPKVGYTLTPDTVDRFGIVY